MRHQRSANHSRALVASEDGVKGELEGSSATKGAVSPRVKMRGKSGSPAGAQLHYARLHDAHGERADWPGFKNNKKGCRSVADGPSYGVASAVRDAAGIVREMNVGVTVCAAKRRPRAGGAAR